MAATSAAHAADAEYLTRKAMTLGYQISSLLAPPIYIAFVLTKRGRAAFSVNRLLRATWIGGLGGASPMHCVLLMFTPQKAASRLGALLMRGIPRVTKVN